MKIIDSPMVPMTPETNLGGRIMLRLLHETRKVLRQRVRKQALEILQIYPITDTLHPPIHLLLCRRDYEMAIISALVLNHLGNKGHRYIFHDDGSLDHRIEAIIHKFLPESVFIRRSDADVMAKQKLSEYPHLLSLRHKNILSLKLTDMVLFAQNDRIAYLDSDVLFFKYPLEYMQALQTASKTSFFNRDISDAYIANSCDIPRSPRINSGLWVVNKENFNFHLMESWLTNSYYKSHLSDYRLEQTFFAMLAGMTSCRHFSTGYDVNFEKLPETAICKHYVGRIRYGYELEGLKYLINKKII
jgi:hypothetical protein